MNRAGATPRALLPVRRARVWAKVAALSIASCAPCAASRAAAAPPEPAEPSPREAAELHALTASPGGFARLSGSIELGDGLRFNNPYRLQTELGTGANAVSRTSSYFDLAGSLTYGPLRGVAQGISIHLSAGLEGVKQQVVTPSYMVEWRRRERLMVYGRFGTPIILAPDPSGGFELAAGAAWFFTARIAFSGEIVGDLFYGAGTLERGTTTYPVLSGQLGLLFEQEILPW